MTWEGDPVRELGLTGTTVGSIPCPYLVKVRGGNWTRAKHAECGQYALLVRFPDPYGLRAVCEEGHHVPLHPSQVPTLIAIKSETD